MDQYIEFTCVNNSFSYHLEHVLLNNSNIHTSSLPGTVQISPVIFNKRLSALWMNRSGLGLSKLIRVRSAEKLWVLRRDWRTYVCVVVGYRAGAETRFYPGSSFVNKD